MNNLLKSKFFIGVVLVTVMLVGVVVHQTATAANCAITSTLKVGSRGAEVQCLQFALGLTPDGVFGPMTRDAVLAFQSYSGLAADGVFGPASRSVWLANVAAVTASVSFPAGCTSNFGYSTSTGMSCSVSSNLPAGCVSTSGFSATTGAPCSSVVVLPSGCTSTAGFSPTTGVSCGAGSQ